MNKPFSYFSKIFLAPIVSMLFIKEIKGRENIPNRNFILASNHQSYVDILLSGSICVPRRFTYLGQVDRENKGWSFFRNFIYSAAEVISVNRNNPDSKKQASEAAVSFLKRGYCLVIYPEGTRTRTGEIQEGKWGAAKIFLRTGVPILPMGINGAFEIFPPGQKPKIEKNVRLNIGNPLFFEREFEQGKNLEADSEEYKSLCADITEKLMDEIKKLTYAN
ncbi:MAG: lysophospholipid acyltransferase family protein [Candidatus Pacebacteria bacterium]|nr:lysophospholipid acyltransferase family protein [Candidatus Paceibacterota bacterium]